MPEAYTGEVLDAPPTPKPYTGEVLDRPPGELSTLQKIGVAGESLAAARDDFAKGIVEAPLAIASGLPVSVASGLAGLITPGSLDERADVVRSGARFAYQPQSEPGKKFTEATNTVFDQVLAGGVILRPAQEWLADRGYPGAATIMEAARQTLLPAKVTAMVTSIPAVAKGVAEAAARRPPPAPGTAAAELEAIRPIEEPPKTAQPAAREGPGAPATAAPAPYHGEVLTEPPKAAYEGPVLASEPKLKITPAESLPAEHRAVESAFIERLEKDPDAAVAAYAKLPDSEGGKILNTDVARELDPAYAKSNESRATLAPAVHEPASALVKEIYRRKLAEPDPNGLNIVTFTAGGAGAGKTSGIAGVPTARAIVDASQIVYDTNLNNFKSATEKIDQALAAGKEVKIMYVARDPVDALVSGALPRAMHRGRTVLLSEHLKTHVGSAEAIQKIAEKYAGDDRVQVLYIDNTRDRGGEQIGDASLPKSLQFDKIEQRLKEALEGEYAAGRISETVYRGTKGPELEAEGRVPRDGVPPVAQGKQPAAPAEAPRPVKEPELVYLNIGVTPEDLARSARGLAEEAQRIPMVRAATEAMPAYVEEVQKAFTPMAAGTDRARAIAKDFANADRLARWQWGRFDEILKKNFSPEERRAMWEAADEENVLRQQGKSTTGLGLDRLSQPQRATMEQLHRYGEQLWKRAQDAGMVQGPGLPFWTPRMIVLLSEEGEAIPARGGGPRTGPTSQPYTSPQGRNIVDRAPSMLHRKHLTTEETEAAASTKFGQEAMVVRDIRAMPMAMSRFERAIAGRALINSIREIGKRTGQNLISDTAGEGYFTVDHPAFTTFRPRFQTNEATGKVEPMLDAEGNPVIDRVPVYVSREFEGPLKAIMSDQPGKIYSALMALKGKTMGIIMYSPLIHNGVEWGRALPLMPGKIATFRAYFEGARAKADPRTMREAIDGGLVPIGHRFQGQDITGLAEEPTLTPGRSWTSQIAGTATRAVLGVKAGEKVKGAIDAAGDFWHNTLLWDRVGDLQMGIYVNMRDAMIAKGLERPEAVKVASHLANRYAGALPNEAMSAWARKAANMTLFSRTFTIGNLGVMKDIFTGLPRDVQAQIARDAGAVAREMAVSAARSKAIHAFALDITLMLAANSLTQDAFDHLKRDKSLSQIEADYVRRFDALLKRTRENPAELLNPIGALESLSSTSENEPGKENRILFDYDDKGTAVYLRLPTGKIGEEFIGWGTSPLDTLKRKEGTIARPIIQTLTNDKGFGRRVYDPDEPGLKGVVKRVGAIVWNLLESQAPVESIKGAKDVVEGKGTETDALKVIGPFFGVTFSQGAPGGPEVGEMFAVDKRHRAEIADAMPDVKRLIKRGEIDEAIGKMREAHMTDAEVMVTLRYANAPGKRLSPRRMKEFYQTAPDEEKERMQRFLDRGK